MSQWNEYFEDLLNVREIQHKPNILHENLNVEENEISIEETKNMTKKIKNGKETGDDNIPP